MKDGEVSSSEASIDAGTVSLTRGDLAVGLGLALLAALVQFDAAFEFRSDDVMLIVQGHETSVLGCFLRSFMRPFADMGAIALYRPLFSFDFGALGHVFGDDPRPHGWINLALQALAVFLGHRSLRCLGAGAWAAAFGTLLFALQPWAVNNVAWLVGRSTTVATLTMLGVFLLDRRARAAGRTWSRSALLLLLLGVFYRETAAMALVLVFLGDRLAGRSWSSSRRALTPLVIVVAFHFLLRYLVIGAVVGGYGKFQHLLGESSGPTDLPGLAAIAFLRLLGAAPGDAGQALDWRTWSVAALGFGALLAALLGRGRNWKLASVLLAVVLLHSFPLLTVDPTVQAGSSQRWHGVLWAMTGLLGLGLAGVDRRLGLVLVLFLAGASGWRLRENLDDYADGARALRSLRAAIARSVEPTILCHGVVPYIGSAPFFEIGAGQLVQPPFGDRGQVLYPLSSVAAHGPDPRRMQTPLAARFAARGENMSPLWLDPESLEVVDMPAADVAAARALFEQRPRLDVASPQEGDAELKLDVDVRGAARIEIHFLAPISELRLVRRRGEGGFEASATRYQEDLSLLAEIGRHLDGRARGLCFLWITAHDDPRALVEPFAVSEIIAIKLDERRR